MPRGLPSSRGMQRVKSLQGLEASGACLGLGVSDLHSMQGECMACMLRARLSNSIRFQEVACDAHGLVWHERESSSVASTALCEDFCSKWFILCIVQARAQ